MADMVPAKTFLPIDKQASEGEDSRSQTVFLEMCRVFLAILKNGESPNNKVKSIALYKLFPRFVNMSMPFLNAELSDYFMRILIRGC